MYNNGAPGYSNVAPGYGQNVMQPPPPQVDGVQPYPTMDVNGSLVPS